MQKEKKYKNIGYTDNIDNTINEVIELPMKFSDENKNVYYICKRTGEFNYEFDFENKKVRIIDDEDIVEKEQYCLVSSKFNNINRLDVKYDGYDIRCFQNDFVRVSERMFGGVGIIVNENVNYCKMKEDEKEGYKQYKFEDLYNNPLVDNIYDVVDYLVNKNIDFCEMLCLCECNGELVLVDIQYYNGNMHNNNNLNCSNVFKLLLICEDIGSGVRVGNGFYCNDYIDWRGSNMLLKTFAFDINNIEYKFEIEKIDEIDVYNKDSNVTIDGLGSEYASNLYYLRRIMFDN